MQNNTQELERLIELYQAHKDRLHRLEIRATKQGITTEPSVITEIEDIREKIEELNDQIFNLDSYAGTLTLRSAQKPLKTVRRLRKSVLVASIVFIILGLAIYNRNNRLEVNANSGNGTFIQAGGNVTLQQTNKDTPLEDAVRLNIKERPRVSAVKGDFDSSKGANYYLKNEDKLEASSDVLYFLDVTSTVSDEWIKIAPFLAVNITKIESTDDKFVELSQAETGGGDLYKSFYGILSPKQKPIFGAPYFPGNGEPKIDFFTLQQGETEGFELLLVGDNGYRYHFQIGIIYYYKGKQYIKWFDKEFTLLSPKYLQLWAYKGDDLQKIYDGEMNSNLEKYIKDNQVKVQRDPTFTLP